MCRFTRYVWLRVGPDYNHHPNHPQTRPPSVGPSTLANSVSICTLKDPPLVGGGSLFAHSRGAHYPIHLAVDGTEDVTDWLPESGVCCAHVMTDWLSLFSEGILINRQLLKVLKATAELEPGMRRRRWSRQIEFSGHYPPPLLALLTVTAGWLLGGGRHRRQFRILSKRTWWLDYGSAHCQLFAILIWTSRRCWNLNWN